MNINFISTVIVLYVIVYKYISLKIQMIHFESTELMMLIRNTHNQYDIGKVMVSVLTSSVVDCGYLLALR
jgi:hypothetical protein